MRSIHKSILVIGGTRYFGRVLVQRLVDAGHSVTVLTRGKKADGFGDSVRRLRADRTNAAALRRALEPFHFDLVYDQMCYNPVDARNICEILDGRADRYIMSSTIEVYEHLRGVVAGDYREQDIDLARLRIDSSYPWHAGPADANYAAGKRQAEAVIATAGFAWATVRIGHVLSGPDDFTGRLADYVGRVPRDEPLRHSADPGPSSFIDRDSIADFLVWLGDRQESGPFNAASSDPLTAIDLHSIISSELGREFRAGVAAAGEALSPFDFPARHAMSNQRATSVGFDFGRVGDRLPHLIRQHAQALAA